mgnify:CR=1 FL=1
MLKMCAAEAIAERKVAVHQSALVLAIELETVLLLEKITDEACCLSRLVALSLSILSYFDSS